MTSARKRPTAGFWIAVALVAVLVGYPLSFGPACWMVKPGVLPLRGTATIYRPVLFAAYRGKPDAVQRVLKWYGSLLNQPPPGPDMFQMAVEARVILIGQAGPNQFMNLR